MLPKPSKCYLPRVRLLEVIQRGTAYLQERNIESPRLQIELLLAHALSMPRLRLYLDFERSLTPSELDWLRDAIRRRGRHEPLQHILGTVVFCGVELEVAPAALIPRPETELLAERAWTFLSDRRGDPAAGPTALDWGTGTGCLAVVMALKVPAARVVALDVCADALRLAGRNAERHGVSGRIPLVESNGCHALQPDQRFDLIVSNPPYIPSAEIESLQPEVRDHDPRLALDGGADGLESHRRLAAELAGRLKPGGGFLVEFGEDQGPAVSAILEGCGWVVVEMHRDYNDRDRFLLAQRDS